MRLDGYNPFTTLPGKSIRPISPTPGNEVARGDQSGADPRSASSRLPATREVNAPAALAEYIPARRDNIEPVHSRAGQALASYQTTASMTMENEVEGVFGIDLYA